MPLLHAKDDHEHDFGMIFHKYFDWPWKFTGRIITRARPHKLVGA